MNATHLGPLSQEEFFDKIVELVENAGFLPELYIASIKNDAVEIEFDDRGAVEYLKEDVRKSIYSDELMIEYRRNGKRHVATFYRW